MLSWYVLHVKTGDEKEVMAAFKKALPSNKILVPQRILKERNNGIWKTVIKTTFPGYVFVQVFMDAEMYYKLNGLPHIIKILGNESGPLPVPEDEMKVIFMLSYEEDPLGISDVYIEGSEIKVISGPLQGFIGKIAKVDPRRFRAKVNIELMGELRVVELGINVITKSESAAC